MTRRAIVTNRDRDWALAQKPDWARMHDDADGEIVDDGGWMDVETEIKKGDPTWFDFVIGEVERFEKYFGDEMKSERQWSELWRHGWWPKRKEEWAFMSRKGKGPFHPFFRKGTPEFERALKVATPSERMVWVRFGVAQFVPDDPRLKKVAPPERKLTDRSHAMAGGK